MLERILIVGLGSIGTRHMRLVRELIPKVQIIALRHQDFSDTKETEIYKSVTSIEEALKFKPQAAVIASPSSHHLETAIRLAQAGVHLLIEKPISNNEKGVLQLLKISKEQKITLMVGYNLRFLPSLQRFRELIQGNKIGRVLSVNAEIGQFLPSWRPDTDYRKSVSANASLGGGVLLELSHEIDYLRWLFGDVEWVSAILSKQSDLEIDVEDIAHLFLGFVPRPGEKAVVASLNMDFIRHDTTRSCTVIGETGTLRWNALTETIDIFEQGGSAWQNVFTHQSQRDDSYRAEWSHFLTCMANGNPPLISGEDGLKVLKIIEAARSSSKAGIRVDL